LGTEKLKRKEIKSDKRKEERSMKQEKESGFFLFLLPTSFAFRFTLYESFFLEKPRSLNIECL